MTLDHSRKKRCSLAHAVLALCVVLGLAGLNPSSLQAAPQESCAACHAGFWQMSLSSLRKDAGPFSPGANQCPGLKAAWMEMAQLEAWILAISVNLEQKSDWRSAERIKQELGQVADLYRLAQTKPVSSVDEIRKAFRKVQKQLNYRVFRPLVAQDKKESLLNILGWATLAGLALAGAYFLARKLQFSRKG